MTVRYITSPTRPYGRSPRQPSFGGVPHAAYHDVAWRQIASGAEEDMSTARAPTSNAAVSAASSTDHDTMHHFHPASNHLSDTIRKLHNAAPAVNVGCWHFTLVAPYGHEHTAIRMDVDKQEHTLTIDLQAIGDGCQLSDITAALPQLAQHLRDVLKADIDSVSIRIRSKEGIHAVA